MCKDSSYCEMTICLHKLDRVTDKCEYYDNILFVLSLFQRHNERDRKNLIVNCIYGMENRLNHEHEREKIHVYLNGGHS